MKEYEINAIDMVDKSGCTSLPVDVRRISDYYNYRIRTYSTSQKLITAMCLNDYINTHNAVSFYHEDSFYILISDNLDLDTERRVIAHEIGHIALRHHRGYDTVRCQCAQYEQEANAFALYLFAPPSLLVGQRIESAAALKDLTHLCMADSRLAYQNLVAYQKVYDILQRPAVLRRRKRDGFRWGVALIGLLLVIATAVALHFFGSPMLRTGSQAQWLARCRRRFTGPATGRFIICTGIVRRCAIARIFNPAFPKILRNPECVVFANSAPRKVKKLPPTAGAFLLFCRNACGKRANAQSRRSNHRDGHHPEGGLF